MTESAQEAVLGAKGVKRENSKLGLKIRVMDFTHRLERWATEIRW